MITPLAIYDLGGIHTHILWQNESDYKKRWHASGLKTIMLHCRNAILAF